MADIHLLVISPSGVRLETWADYVQLPTDKGFIGILPNHAAMLCDVDAGAVRYQTDSGQAQVEIGNGIASVGRNEVKIFLPS